MAGLPHVADVGAGIVIQHHAYVNRPFVILFDGFDHGDLAIEREIHDVAAGPRAQTDATAFAKLGLIRQADRLQGRLVFEETPLQFIHDRSPARA